MIEFSDKTCNRLGGEPCVGIKCHDKPAIHWQTWIGREETGIAITTQKQIQFMKLAAFTLPAHIATFTCIEETVAMQNKE